MANGINKVIIVGNLGSDPEYGVTQNNKARTVLSIATSEQWKDKQTGEMIKDTQWHRVHIYNALADICANYLHKGSKVYIEGKNKTAKWTDDNGNKRYMHYVHAHIMQMLDPATKNAQGAYEAPVRQHDNGTQASYSAPPDHTVYENLDEYGNDDIPF